jgi:predicted dehydrogenase
MTMGAQTTPGPLRVGVIDDVGMTGADLTERVANRVANAKLVAVADTDQDRATQLAARFDGVEAFTDPLS